MFETRLLFLSYPIEIKKKETGLKSRLLVGSGPWNLINIKHGVRKLMNNRLWVLNFELSSYWQKMIFTKFIEKKKIQGAGFFKALLGHVKICFCAVIQKVHLFSITMKKKKKL